ncbi:putative RNA-binding protein 15B [Rhinatrema bivittatum]|uniref:putative RNA-binding protein 15B n=1 Tax=Rhinatrema bivittatum TaxID=194408 RepID=UPI0011291288|nr:putative RNA-binding protein 15B [Rhinatrema bivittatum]
MKRQGERDSSPSRATSKRPRERERERERERDRDREREREREGGSRREDGTSAPTASDSSSSNSRAYHKSSGLGSGGAGGGSSSSTSSSSKRQARSGSRDREKPSSRRDDRAAAAAAAAVAADINHRLQHLTEVAANMRLPMRAGAAAAAAAAAVVEPADRVTASLMEYKTLLISNLGSQLSNEHIEDGLFHEFKKFGDISVKLSHTPELGRVAYVNFRHPDDARDARHAKGRLVLYDRLLKVEPVFSRIRSTTPPELPFLPLHGSYQFKQRSLSPVANAIRDQRPRHAIYPLEAVGLSRERERALEYYSMYDERGRPYSYAVPEEDLMPEDDQRATRNLFIGNLDHSVTEIELRHAFEKYGMIEEVVIKRPARGQGGTYAFLKFQNLDMAHRAKVAMSGRVFGRNPIKIGYGKANPTTRLWVGGLGPNTSLAALAREFDRFGSIRIIDYVKGDNFAYIQYESLDAAQAACVQMRGFPLGGPERRLRVDFAKAEEARYPPQYPQTAVPVPYELLPDGYSRHRSLEADLRVRDRTPPHLLYSDRERPFIEGDWSSPLKASERRNNLESYSRLARSRSGDRWGSDSEPKPWAERRKRRSLSSERGRAAHSPYEDRARTKASGQTSERSPDRPRKENHSSESGLEKDQTVPEEKGRQDTIEPSPLRKRESERNHRAAEAEPKPKAADEPKAEPKKPKTLVEYAHTLRLAWTGHLVLKNSCFPTSMHILEGDPGIPNALLKDYTSGGKLTQLKIAQRLRLDQPKLDEVTRRIKQGSPDGFAVLLATQSPQGAVGTETALPTEPGIQRRLLRNLVSYLKQKQAAGVISLPVGGGKGREGTGMLYAFPPGDFSQQYLQAAVRILGKVEEEHMVIVIVKDAA